MKLRMLSIVFLLLSVFILSACGASVQRGNFQIIAEPTIDNSYYFVVLDIDDDYEIIYEGEAVSFFVDDASVDWETVQQYASSPSPGVYEWRAFEIKNTDNEHISVYLKKGE